MDDNGIVFKPKVVEICPHCKGNLMECSYGVQGFCTNWQKEPSSSKERTK